MGSEDNKEYDFVATLAFLVEGKNVWLAPKKNKLGKKRLNGYGGEVEEGDVSVKARAVEEIWDEARVVVREDDLELVAVGYFKNIKSDETVFVCKVFIYLVRQWVGIPCETKEMGKPKKYNRYELPFERMIPADRFWLPEILKGQKIIISATMKNGQSGLVGDVELIKCRNLFDIRL